MRARSLAASGCLVTALALGVAACGGGNDNSSTSSGGGGGGRTSLTIYSSLPLQGDSRAQSESVVNGEKLALQEAGGKVGKFTIKYVSLDDATAAAGKWDPGQTSADARKAAQDASTIAYLGEFNSGATEDLAPGPQRGEHPAGLPVQHLRRPDALRGRPQGRAGQVLPLRQAHLRPRRARRPYPGGSAGRPTRRIRAARRPTSSTTRRSTGRASPSGREARQGQGLQILGNDGIDTKAANFRTLATKIKSPAPTACSSAASPRTRPCRSSRTLTPRNPTAKLFGPDGVADPAFYTKAGSTVAK